MTVERIFLGWHEPFLGLAAESLLADRDALPSTLVIVPTSQAGRRLREAMAEKAGALLSPKIVTPGSMLRTPDPSVAVEWIERLAWIETLEEVGDWSQHEALFPDSPQQEGTWADSLAAEFIGIRRSLQEAGLTLESAAGLLGNSVESERWDCLKRLEKSMESKLRQWGYESRSRVLARGITIPPGIARIVLAGLSELPPILRKSLKNSEHPIIAMIGAPAEESDHFCEFGTPLNDWAEKIIPLPRGSQGSVCLVADSKQQASEAVRLVADARTPSQSLAIGCGDSSDGETLARAFDENGWTTFHPGARGVTSGLVRWFKLWAEWLAKPQIYTIADLLALPESVILAGPNRADAAKTLSSIRDQHIINGADDLRRLIHIPKLWRSDHHLSSARWLLSILEAFEKRRHAFEQNGAERGISDMLSELVEHADSTGVEWVAMQDFVTSAAAFMRRMKRPPEFWVSLMLSQLPAPAPQPPEDRAIDIQGWLELFFEPGHHLVICGMNEGRVPASVSNDPWLGEKARAWVGLITSAQRAARDAFLFRSMLEARRSAGRVDILCSKSGSSGDTLLPSRFLLAASSEELPERVKSLFQEVQPPESSLKWERDWHWRPTSQPRLEKIHVTSLRDYIACPFRFYLKHVCRMNKNEPERNEWSFREFGNIVHEIFEAFGKDPDARDSSDPDFIGSWLSDKLDETVATLHGDTPPLAIRIQTEALRQRLNWAASIQAEQRNLGWQISETELPVELTIGGFLIKAKIDRIDRHEVTGALRVIDYKTGKVKQTDQSHRKKESSRKERPAHLAAQDCPVFFERPGKNKNDSYQWIDLQLPLYSHAMMLRQQTIATPTYFCIGATESEVIVSEWENFTEEDLEAAVACTEWITAQVREGIFWPPAEKPTYDDFDILSCGKPLIDLCEEIREEHASIIEA